MRPPGSLDSRLPISILEGSKQPRSEGKRNPCPFPRVHSVAAGSSRRRCSGSAPARTLAGLGICLPHPWSDLSRPLASAPASSSPTIRPCCRRHWCWSHVFTPCVCSLQLCLVRAQMERVLKDDAVEEKGERARMVRLPTPLSVIRSVFVPSYVFPPFLLPLPLWLVAVCGKHRIECLGGNCLQWCSIFFGSVKLLRPGALLLQMCFSNFSACSVSFVDARLSCAAEPVNHQYYLVSQAFMVFSVLA